MPGDPIAEYIAQLQGSEYYDPTLAAITSAAQRRAADLQSQYTVGQGNLNTNFDTEKYGIEKGLDQSLAGILGNKASQGTLRSSIFVNDQGKASQGAQDSLNQAALRRTQGMSSLEQGMRSGNSEILSNLSLGQADATNRQAAARHQAELQRQEQAYREQQLQMQRDSQAQQQQYYQQQMAMQQQATAQQNAATQQMINAMQPVTRPNGQVRLPAASGEYQFGSRQPAQQSNNFGKQGGFQDLENIARG